MDQVQRKSQSLADKCLFWHNEEESIDHIFVHCVKARVLW